MFLAAEHRTHALFLSKNTFKALKGCSSLIKEMSYRFQTTLQSKAISIIYFRIGPMEYYKEKLKYACLVLMDR